MQTTTVANLPVEISQPGLSSRMAASSQDISSQDTPSQTELTSLNGRFAEGAVNMSLTEAGLLPERTKAIVRLYAEHHSWSEVKQRWHEDRIHDRGSRGSAQKIYRILKRRLQAGGAALPSISTLHDLIEECPTTQAEAQLFYFYLIEEDNLFKFALHEVLRRQGTSRKKWSLSTGQVASVLSDYEYVNGESLEYADSSIRRWAQGFRSVLRDIGVLDSPYDEVGTVPTVDGLPAHLSALYSWNREGKEWQRRPIGWLYLFQPPARREMLLGQLQSSRRWSTTRLRDEVVVTPRESETGTD